MRGVLTAFSATGRCRGSGLRCRVDRAGGHPPLRVSVPTVLLAGRPFVLPAHVDVNKPAPPPYPEQPPPAPEPQQTQMNELCSGIENASLNEKSWEDEGEFDGTLSFLCDLSLFR